MESSHFNNNVTSDISLVTIRWDAMETTEDMFMEEVKTYTEFKVSILIQTYWNSILIPRCHIKSISILL